MDNISILSVCSAVFHWDWFYTNNKAPFFVRIFSRTGARIFYTLLGSFLMYVALHFQAA
ncbi:MAG: immunity 17 family protein [Neisseriaceae bacterium]|nr:immunity 17 family protein [Neisseriaceae bacterium]